MTTWLNRGAKKTNEPTIPLILQAFGWLNRAALARAADRTSAAAAHDRSFAPNRIRSWTSASRRPGGAKAGRPQCQCEAGGLARAVGANKVNAPFTADLSMPCFGDDHVAEPRRQKD